MLIIDAMAFLVIAIGTIEMFILCLGAVYASSPSGHEVRDGYLRYARWLIAKIARIENRRSEFAERLRL